MCELSCYLHKKLPYVSSTTLRPSSHRIYQRVGYINYQVYQGVSYRAIHIKVIGDIFHHPSLAKSTRTGMHKFRVSDVWVTMLFTRKLSRDTWSPLPPPPDKFIKTRVHKIISSVICELSGCFYVNYQVRGALVTTLFTQHYCGMFQQKMRSKESR